MAHYTIATKKEKKRARSLLQMAVRRGKIVRPSVCSACGDSCKPEGHHEDYAKPYDVRWLCDWCHIALHGNYAGFQG